MQLKDKNGYLDNDTKWGILNKQLITHAQNSNWGLYRNTRLEMAEILKKESKLRESLETYLEVCYLDLNGPNNKGGMGKLELLKEFPSFDPKTSFLAPGVITHVKRISKKLGLDKNEIRDIFIKHNNRIEKSLGLLLSPENCWHSIEENHEFDF